MENTHKNNEVTTIDFSIIQNLLVSYEGMIRTNKVSADIIYFCRVYGTSGFTLSQSIFKVLEISERNRDKNHYHQDEGDA